MIYKDVTKAFESLYNKIDKQPAGPNGTKAIYNECFTIKDTSKLVVKTPWRNFKDSYAEKEWKWYLSGNRNAEDIAKCAKIWYDHMDENGNVNSNYGWQWWRNDQYRYVVEQLKYNRFSRRAVITIYDGKEWEEYEKDTPCTLAIKFYCKADPRVIHMSVVMRSNDLWFGFCSDAYCFMKLHESICADLNAIQGEYTHYAQNLHLYPRHYGKNI